MIFECSWYRFALLVLHSLVQIGESYVSTKEKGAKVREEFRTELRRIFKQARDEYREAYEEWTDTAINFASEANLREEPIRALVRTYQKRLSEDELIALLAEAYTQRIRRDELLCMSILLAYLRNDKTAGEVIETLTQYLIYV